MAIATLESVKQQQEASGDVPSLPSNLAIPRDRYSWRIKEASFGPSKSSGKNQITLDTELYAPAVVNHPLGGKYNVAGTNCKKYLPVEGDGLKFTLEFMVKIGLKGELDTENPDLKQFEGKCFSQVAQGKETTQRKDLTAAQIAEGKKKWEADPILGEDGKPSITYTTELVFATEDSTKIAPPANPF